MTDIPRPAGNPDGAVDSEPAPRLRSRPGNVVGSLASRVVGRVVGRARSRGLRPVGDAGMTTAEYAVGTVAAAGFAALLYKLVTSDAVFGQLGELLDKAFGWVL